MNFFSNILPFESVMLSKWEMASFTVKEKNKSVCVWASLVCLWQHIRAERTPPKINIFTNHTRAWPTASLAQDQSSESSKH